MGLFAEGLFADNLFAASLYSDADGGTGCLFAQGLFAPGLFAQGLFSCEEAQLSADVEAAEFSIDGQPITLLLSGTSVQPSGGYGFGAYDRELQRRRREQEEKRELADRLEAVMLQEGSLSKPDADLIRLRGLVASYDELPNKAKRAALYAERARTEQALNLALREIARLQEEEEMAILMAIALDD